MAVACVLKTEFKLTGLGREVSFDADFDITDTDQAPAQHTGKQYRTLATGGTEEALDMGGVDTTDTILIWIKAVDYDLDVDTSYSVTFSSEITIKAGEDHRFRVPANASVYVKNTTGVQTPSYEYIAIGQ